MSDLPLPEPEPPKALPPDPRISDLIASDRLTLDKRTQRELDIERVMRIANEFNWYLFETPTVLDNGAGGYIVVEGQHRCQAIKYLDGMLGTTTLIPCSVIPPLSAPEQAQLALDISKGRRRHSAYEEWELRVVALHEHELAATTVLRARGLRLGKAPSSHTIGAVATITSVIHGASFTPEYGADLLAKTLDTITAAFPDHDPESNTPRWERNILLAVSELLHRNPDCDYARLAKSLRVRPAPQWISIARGQNEEPRHVVVASRVLAIYNKGLRNGRMGW